MAIRKRTARVAVPKALAIALAEDQLARARFQSMPPSHQGEHIKYITDAKKTETRAKRVTQTIARLRQKPAN